MNLDIDGTEPSLPDGIRSRWVDNSNGLTMHYLEAGFDGPERPCILLLHGFPELAYSWRKIMVPLAEAGFHVIAPDQRGYGATTGWDAGFDCDLNSFRMLNLVRDALGLIHALGRRSVAAVVGHDFGSPVAAYCALIRPDVFRSVVLMSAPFAGAPALPYKTADQSENSRLPEPDIHQALAELQRPRKHYQAYYSTRPANDEMWHCPQGIHAFMRAYYHHKSADWEQNRPAPLASWTADELARLPSYYIMDLDQGMAETVAPHMPSQDEIDGCEWLTENELEYYSATFQRTGYQGGLNWYRCVTHPGFRRELEIFSGLAITVPSCFIAGKSDWGVHQVPGAFQSMQTSACTRMLGCTLVEGAGHWVQQEQPKTVLTLLNKFLAASG